MSFDQDRPPGPIVHLEKKTTQVNIAVVLGVLMFFVAMLVVGFWAWDRYGRPQPVPSEQLSK